MLYAITRKGYLQYNNNFFLKVQILRIYLKQTSLHVDII